MNQLEDQLGRMNDKLQQLLRKYLVLQKENERLRLDIEEVNNRGNSLLAESEKWRQQAEILKLSKGQMGEAEKKAFEKRLNQYVKEIDRCIAMLGE
jgi:hypothetical protein